MLLWILDLSTPIVSELTIPQRAWLYANISGANAEHLMTVESQTNFSLGFIVTNAIGDNDIFDRNISILRKEVWENPQIFHKSPTEIPRDIYEALTKVVAYTKNLPKDRIYEEYGINNLHQLLLLEILQMIKLNTEIRKCKNCGMYFVVANRGTSYCDRIAAGEKRPCHVIGARRTFEKKLESDPGFEIYRSFYKKYQYQVKTGAMDKMCFNSWAKEAKKMLESVRAEGMDVDEFAKKLIFSATNTDGI
jgi:hypothetical protein